MTRVTTSARRDLDTPLAEGDTGSWFDRFVVKPFVVAIVMVTIGAGIVMLVVVFTLH